MSKLKFKQLTEQATLPTRGSEHAAGLDLYASAEAAVLPDCVTSVSTGIAVEIPPGWYGRIAPRSGLAVYGIHVLGGVIDSDYRGEIKVMLTGNTEYHIAKGDRVAQLIIEKIATPEAVWVEELDETERDANGFGSTGR